MVKYLHLEEEVINKAVQTLINAKLILVRKEENYVANLNKEQFDKYFSIPMSKIPEGKGIPMADEVTWNVEEGDAHEMSVEEMKRTILILQAKLNEHEQAKELIKKSVTDDLLF